MSRIFVGRHDEQDELVGWVETEPASPVGDRAALLIGPAGMGKSALLLRFEELCIEHGPEDWYVHRAKLNANETPSSFLERLLVESYRLFRGLPLRTGPRDRRLFTALLKAVPAAGELLGALVDKDMRPGWRRFLDYAGALSDALEKDNGRFILLVDPDPTVHTEQAAEWYSIAGELPPRVRVLIAQRPDDVVAADPESRRRFRTMPKAGSLGDLGRDDVELWYQAEFTGGRLTDSLKDWPADVQLKLPAAAYERFRGHPLAHDAVVRLLLGEPVSDPLAAIQEWPPELAKLLDMLLARLEAQGKDRLRAALLLRIFGVPTPRETWAKAAGLSAEDMMAALDDPKYRHFFASDDDGRYEAFHMLFAERLERRLREWPQRQRELAQAAWEGIAPLVDPERLESSRPDEFELLAAINVATRFDDRDWLLSAVNLVGGVKRRVGLLTSAEADLQLVLARYGHEDETIRAVNYGNLGLIYRTRGELDRAEEMHCKSLEISERLGRLEGVAAQYGNLGTVHFMRGELDRAEEMHRKSLAIYENLGRLEGVATEYGNLGNTCFAQSELDRAEEMYRKALEIDEKLGRLEGMANQYGNLGVVYLMRAELDPAEELLRESLAIDEKLGRLEGMANGHANLGAIAKQRNRPAEARALWMRARELYEQIGMAQMVEKMQGWLDALPEGGEDAPAGG